VVNCLNFGNPEHPAVMRQLSDAIDGLAEACRALRVPVVGGNVSLYNESRGTDIDPTPVVGMLGMVDRLERRAPASTLVDGGRLLLVGPRSSDLGGSRWAATHHAGGRPVGALPALDLGTHAAVCDLVRSLVADGLVAGIHDIADGGMAAALVEMVAGSGVGATLAGVEGHGELFAEAASRVLVCVAAADAGEVRRRAGDAGVGVVDLGEAGGDRLVVDGLVDLPVAEVAAAWRDLLPAAFAVGAVSG
jgi:phosphoribosylformylglycinamidine synthase